MDEKLGLGLLQCTYVEYVWCPGDCLSLVWGHSVHFAKFPILQFFYSSAPLTIFIQTLYKISYHTGCHFFGDLPKIAKIMALWNFLNTGPYAAGIFNFSYNFHCSLSKLCHNIGYYDKSKCLLEYCNEKLASRTWDNIFHLQLFKKFLCTGSSVQVDRQGPWDSCFCF